MDRPKPKTACLDVIAGAHRDLEVDSVILGCTEVTMLIGQADTDLPVLDTTPPLHAESAMKFALS